MSGRLVGRRVAVTRSGEPDDPLVRALEDEGADVVRWPTLRFFPPADPAELTEALTRDWAWIAVTSPRAAEALGAPPSPQARTPVAAVGPRTAGLLRAAGWSVQVVGGSGAEALADQLAGRASLADARVLFPAGDRARDALADALAERGARVTRVEAYRTRTEAPGADRLTADLDRGLDAATFASPSAVRALDAALPAGLADALAGVVLVAIGPTTAGALESVGCAGVRLAPAPRVDALVDAVADALTAPAVSEDD